MKSLRGIPVSPGYAEGTAFVYEREFEPGVSRYRIEPNRVEREWQRFEAARERAGRELETVRDRVSIEFGRAEAEIFSAHLTLLTDPGFAERVRRHIEDDLVNAEQAVEEAISEMVARLASLQSDYLREREQDIRDIGRRVQRQLAGGIGAPLVQLSPHSIVVARELLPSDTLHLDRSHVDGIVTERGGETGHAAILARSLGIPAVTGVAEITSIATGTYLLVDGETGTVTIDPGRTETEQFSQERTRYEHLVSAAAAAEAEECVTPDGVRVHLYANIGRPEEVEQVESHHLEGVGLFRTEYLFLDATEPPGFEAQYEFYRQVADRLGDLPVTIRTMDFGGDKYPEFLALDFEKAQDRGLRGLRFALAEGSLLRTQLRALLHLAVTRNVLVLFPMVLGSDDLQRAMELMSEIADEEGVGKLPPVGAMIETPSAIFALDEILERVDFISIGTNDLTQYMLAADRNVVGLVDDTSVLHPSLVRAIAKIVEVAQKHGRPVSVCGEAAGDPRIAYLLVGLGIRQLSMSPVRAARVRQALRETSCRELEELAQKALRCDSPEAVRGLLKGLSQVSPDVPHGTEAQT